MELGAKKNIPEASGGDLCSAGAQGSVAQWKSSVTSHKTGRARFRVRVPGGSPYDLTCEHLAFIKNKLVLFFYIPKF